MPTDKEVKAEFKKIASKEPDKYYATAVLKKEGFIRKQCRNCGTFFWTTEKKREFCGNAVCSGGFGFIGKSPAKHKLDYIETWEKFSSLFRKWGYTPIKRYPVVARWRPDVYWVGASIYDFQPYVVSGEIKPPANPLVVPQFCLRFNDIDNVGITGAHYTGFVMIGQHAFMPPRQWNQAKYFTDILNWLRQGLGLEDNEITFHEDAWAGGGNFGPCMEYFSRGLELGNQVYMMFQRINSGSKELGIKVLDMGMGHERNAWFSQGTATSYETTFPSVMKKLRRATGIKVDEGIVKKFLPYSSYLNFDETESLEKAWRYVSEQTGIDVKNLKENILPLAALYSIAEHSRAALVAISDSALPSNVGGGYNLRIIIRRALAFIEQYKWDISLPEICAMHARYLKPIFPELSKNLGTVEKILDVEKEKYLATNQRARQVVERIIKEEVTDKKLLMLYDTQGILPEAIKEEAEKLGRKIEVPENFYARVSELHKEIEEVAAVKKEELLPLDDLPETQALYFDNYKKTEFKAKVLKIINNAVVLDKTAFFPVSGGQDYDTGMLGGSEVVEVFKQGAVIVHRLREAPKFKEGDFVDGKINEKRRIQLAQHHTATHIINAAARRILGPHINQAGAKKTEEKAHLDVTHYQAIAQEELKKIEDEANRIVKENIKINLMFMPRNEAEEK
ncbi:MAG: alanine--tRNA ligase-related protein, partial [Candidatus Nanoarchaeia archaeon]